MQIWNMKMKMGVIKVIYEAPQSHLWRRHDSLVSFMCGRPSLSWQASLPGAAVSLQGRAKVTYRVAQLLCSWFILLIKMCDRSLCIWASKDTTVFPLLWRIPRPPTAHLLLPPHQNDTFLDLKTSTHEKLIDLLTRPSYTSASFVLLRCKSSLAVPQQNDPFTFTCHTGDDLMILVFTLQ